MAQLTVLSDRLEAELTKARERLATSEAEVAELRARLRESHVHDATLAEAAANLARVRDDADRRAHEIVEAARAEAAAIRTAAETEVHHAQTQVETLLELRQTLGRSMRSLVSEVEDVVAKIESPPPQPPPATDARPTGEAPAPAPASQPQPQPIRDMRPVAPPSPPREDDVFDRQIELDAGPFTDFASLSAFERALASLPKVQDVYIRRFEGDRATIDVTLAEPAPLLDEMTERLPYRLDVQSAVADRISVTVSSAA